MNEQATLRDLFLFATALNTLNKFSSHNESLNKFLISQA